MVAIRLLKVAHALVESSELGVAIVHTVTLFIFTYTFRAHHRNIFV